MHRIDGPRVWIELTVQGGIIYKGKVHDHTSWRDKASDYGEIEIVRQERELESDERCAFLRK